MHNPEQKKQCNHDYLFPLFKIPGLYFPKIFNRFDRSSFFLFFPNCRIDVHPAAEQQRDQVTHEKHEHPKVKSHVLNFSVIPEEMK